LSIEHQRSVRRSRVGASVVRGASFSADASASAAGGMVGSRPRSRMARTAMARSRARSDFSIMFRSYLLNGGGDVLDEGVDLRLVGAKAQDAHSAEESAVRRAAGEHHAAAAGGSVHQGAGRGVLLHAGGSGPREVEREQRQIR